MRRPRHNTTSLPRDLRAELGIRDTYGEKKNRNNGPASRKERRREERSGKKQPQFQRQQRGPPPKKRGRYDDDEDDDEDMGDFDDFDLDEGDHDEDAGDVMANLAKAKAAKGKGAAPAPAKEEKKQPKSILKKAKAVESSEEEDDDIDLDEDEDNEVTMRRPISKTVQSKLEEDDAEIAALEKKLGLKKGKKLPKSFEEDGLGDLLGDLDEDSADEGRKRKREADEWLRSKRRKAQGLEEPEEEDSEEEDDSDMGDGLEGFDDDESMGDFDEDEEGDEDEDEEEEPAPKKKENPYVAPVKEAESRPQKYIPPSLRAASNSEDESLVRLRRQAQGHLNKLSEANMVSILAEFEKLYRDHPRQNVTSTLISLLFGLICERSALSDTFIILHAGFIAAVYKIVGTDFGAEIVQKIVETFDARGDERGKFEGKETINLISLLSQLYNFHVIGSTLVFDYIRLFLEEITEENTELLLKIIRSTLFPSLPS